MTIKQILTELKEWVIDLTQFLLISLVLSWCIISGVKVISGSMTPACLAGDCLLISNIHYGARTPQTPLHIPFTTGKIPGTNIPSFLTYLQLPIYRFPGLSKVKKGDCVLFAPPRAARELSHNPEERDYPQDVSTSMLKRCVGEPGETFNMSGSVLFTDGKPEEYSSLQHRYKIETDRRLSDSFFEKYKINKYSRLPEGGAYVYTTKSTKKKLESLPSINNAKLMIEPRNATNSSATFAKTLGGSTDYFPKITAPKKGAKVTISKKAILYYGEIIRYYEGHKKVKMEDGKLWIDDGLVKEYVFKQNYYVMMGDNRHDSNDFRSWGFLPESHIIGKAVIILFSTKDIKKYTLVNILTGNLRWDRFLKRV